MAWVDNFIIMGNPIEEYQEKKKRFLSRATKLLNVQLADIDRPPQRQIGLASDFVLDWDLLPIVTLLEAIGSVVWFCYVTQTPLCHSPRMMETLRATAFIAHLRIRCRSS